MTSYPALTFPRKNKRPAKEKAIAPTGDPESEQMYSTLSKRPAGKVSLAQGFTVALVCFTHGEP